MVKKRIMGVIGILTLLSTVAQVACSRLSDQSKDMEVLQLTLGAYEGDTAALVWIAEEQGYFEAEVLDIEIKGYEAGKLAVDALLAGEVDIATGAEFVLVRNSFESEELRLLGSIAFFENNELIARRDHAIQDPKDLIDKRIGVTRKSAGEFFLGRFLLFNGLSLQDVTIVDLTPSQIVEAISAGEIDAALTWDPNIFEIKKRLGENEIHWSGQIGQDMYFVILGMEAWVTENELAVERFLKALAQAEDYIRSNNENAMVIIQERFGYDPSYMTYIWAKHQFNMAFPQDLLIAMEDEARWVIENNLTEMSSIPNYLDYVYLEPMLSVSPESVTIIR